MSRPLTTTRHRCCVVLRGTAETTAHQSLAHLEDFEPTGVLWVSQGPTPPPFQGTPPSAVKRLLGRSFEAVVMDLHQEFSADVLGQCQGFILGGGALLLRLPEAGEHPSRIRSPLAILPHSEAEVGTRAYQRFEAALDRCDFPDAPTLARPTDTLSGTDEQARLVDRMVEILTASSPAYMSLIADRGRGKSSAIGLALARAAKVTEARVAITAGQRNSTDEVFRFALDDRWPSAQDTLSFVPLADLVYAPEPFDIIVVDEAAQLPVPMLQRLVHAHPEALLIFATTARGYEGTGRGFVLRFLEWLDAQSPPLHRFTLNAPIRWSAKDPVEAFIFDALLLDADIATVDPQWDVSLAEHIHFDRDELAQDEDTLRALFGLMVHAHYRTTPADLHRMLDGPNLHLHGLRLHGKLVAATMVAKEGALPADLCRDIQWGRARVRGHALPETLISHSGYPEAGEMTIIRSVRIAVHPELRRRGLASRLIEAVHKTYEPDLFGTLFGATPALLKFRRSVGYELVRLGASRGTRTGEPAAVMIRPNTHRARRLLGALRGDLARDLPVQLQLMQAGRELLLHPDLDQAVRTALPEAAELTADRERQMVATFAFGPRTQEAAATALTRFVRTHETRLEELTAVERALIQSRILERKSWSDVLVAGQQPSIPSTMRALRRAVRSFVMHADPLLQDLPSADSTPHAVSDIIGKLDDYLQDPEVQEKHIGVAFCMVDQGRTYFSNHGLSTLNPEIPMHQDCLLPIGSVTKTLTGLAAVKLALDGAFSLEDTVAASFDSLPAGSPFESITWHQILSHRAGLPREPDNFTFGRITPYEDYGPEAVHEAMSTYDGPAAGPHPWAYSNFGYLIIGEHLKRLTQSNYETLIKDLVTQHFRENDARIDLVDGDRWGLGHGQDRVPQPMGFFNSFEAVGGLRASARFLAGYIQGCLNPESIPALQDALNLSLTIDDDGHGKNTAFSWNIRELDGRRIYYHSGFVRGCKGSVMFCPEMDRGLAYVCNTPFHIRTIFDLMMT